MVSKKIMDIAIDSKTFYPIFVASALLSIVLRFIAIVALAPIVPLLLTAASVFWLKRRPKDAMRFSGLSIVSDLLMLIILSRFYMAILYPLMLYWISVPVMWFLITRELSIIPRPVFSYNQEEAKKARKALKTKDPNDIMAISKYRAWSEQQGR